MFEPQSSFSWFHRALFAIGTLLALGLMAAVALQSTCRVAVGEEKQPAAQSPSPAAEKPAGENPAEKPDPYQWQSLFDGKTLKGWKIPEFGGEGKVHVEDGAIVLPYRPHELVTVKLR